MINRLSDSIANFFISTELIPESDKKIYKYGTEIAISSLIGILLILTIGIFFRYITDSIIFLLCFISVRTYAGGYHSKTYLKCNMTFISIYLTRIFVLFIVSIASIEIEPYFSLILLTLSMAVILKYSPIENINKPFGKSEMKKYRQLSIILSATWSLAAIISLFINSVISQSISLTMISIAILMIVEIINKKGGES